jgi:hypothetical protein
LTAQYGLPAAGQAEAAAMATTMTAGQYLFGQLINGSNKLISLLSAGLGQL